MPQFISETELPVVDANGKENGTLRIWVKPGARKLGVEAISQIPAESESPYSSVQLVEAHEYGFELTTNSEGALSTDHPEMFIPLTSDGRTGFLRTAQFVGTAVIRITQNNEEIGTASFEVRSSKLDYLTEFRWMLEDISDWTAEAALEGFAPTTQKFDATQTGEIQTLYHRFALIAARLNDPAEFDAALGAITIRPHHLWIGREEERPIGSPFKPTPATVRSLLRASARVPWTGGVAGMDSLPRKVHIEQQEPSLDTVPNRFVRFALETWRGWVWDCAQVFVGAEGPTADRARRECSALLDKLDAALAEPIFAEVGRLTTFPAGDQTLEKRDGYRQIFRLFFLTELVSNLSWDGAEDVFAAGSRDVATLYEYWAFLAIAEMLERVSDCKLQKREIFAATDRGMTLSLRQGKEAHISGDTRYAGRRLGIALFFNRTFSSFSGAGASGSWSRQMRPDVSLLVRPLADDEPFAPLATRDQDAWVHLDAKYRLERIIEQFGQARPDASEAEAADIDEREETRGRSRRQDLLKMHAYRDAIRRSAGAYVLYPGDEAHSHSLREYHELLPGLGAFALRPCRDTAIVGSETIETFLHDVLIHAATQGSQRERARFWETRSFRRAEPSPPGTSDFLTQPPADTDVLLGYARDAQWEWVRRSNSYNLRADDRRGAVQLDSRELASAFVLIYNEGQTLGLFRASARRIATGDDLRAAGYPGPRGRLYVMLDVDEWVSVERWPPGLQTCDLAKLQRVLDARGHRVGFGAPVVTTWAELVRFASGAPRLDSQ
jgi:predicted component of viral defense system (DUF524 family)